MLDSINFHVLKHYQQYIHHPFHRIGSAFYVITICFQLSRTIIISVIHCSQQTDPYDKSHTARTVHSINTRMFTKQPSLSEVAYCWKRSIYLFSKTTQCFLKNSLRPTQNKTCKCMQWKRCHWQKCLVLRCYKQFWKFDSTPLRKGLLRLFETDVTNICILYLLLAVSDMLNQHLTCII